jgi:hypothetical protein
MLRLLVLSFETVRWGLRLDAIDEVRRRSVDDDAGSDSNVLRRDDVGPREGVAVLVEFERCGSSVLDELALDVLISVSLAPCLDRGGGGGDFATDKGSLLLGAGFGGDTASTDCCEEMVKEELLRDRLPVVDDRSWLCLRANGTGGGAFFWGRGTSEMASDSLDRC